MQVARIKEIFLPQMTKLRANFPCNFEMVVDDKQDAGTLRDGRMASAIRRISSRDDVLARN